VPLYGIPYSGTIPNVNGYRFVGSLPAMTLIFKRPRYHNRQQFLGNRMENLKWNLPLPSFLHFSPEICILNAETIIKRMSRIREKFSQVDEVHSTKFLKIRNQT
jgi:hypothetical protein